LTARKIRREIGARLSARVLVEEPLVNSSTSAQDTALCLRVGELVEVRSADEILATLDAKGEIDGLPFMPEMLQFCGRRLRIFRTAHKTCDTITGQLVARRMEHCVHLEGARCDGAAHGGCQAGCLLFWKEAWLKRVEADRSSLGWRLLERSAPSRRGNPEEIGSCTAAHLEARHRQGGPGRPGSRLPMPGHAAGGGQPTPGVVGADTVSARLAVGQLVAWHPASRHAAADPRRRGYVRQGFRIKRKVYNKVAHLFGEPAWPYAWSVPRAEPHRRL